MTPADVTQKVLELARRRFPGSEALTADADLFTSLGIDSVQALELLTELERTFGVEVPDYELLDVRTFADLAQRVSARL
ncbi:MAG: acyl carrier protein [Planctomycetes bacterium]|nr:acyl carrier protein [Planctomycetota bacterium]